MLVAAKLDGVKTYMRMRRVPNHLQVKVIKWFDYLWLTQKCSDEEKAVSCLPGKSAGPNLPEKFIWTRAKRSSAHTPMANYYYILYFTCEFCLVVHIHAAISATSNFI